MLYKLSVKALSVDPSRGGYAPCILSEVVLEILSNSIDFFFSIKKKSRLGE